MAQMSPWNYFARLPFLLLLVVSFALIFANATKGDDLQSRAASELPLADSSGMSTTFEESETPEAPTPTPSNLPTMTDAWILEVLREVTNDPNPKEIFSSVSVALPTLYVRGRRGLHPPPLPSRFMKIVGEVMAEVVANATNYTVLMPPFTPIDSWFTSSDSEDDLEEEVNPTSVFTGQATEKHRPGHSTSTSGGSPLGNRLPNPVVWPSILLDSVYVYGPRTSDNTVLVLGPGISNVTRLNDVDGGDSAVWFRYYIGFRTLEKNTMDVVNETLKSATSWSVQSGDFFLRLRERWDKVVAVSLPGEEVRLSGEEANLDETSSGATNLNLLNQQWSLLGHVLLVLNLALTSLS